MNSLDHPASFVSLGEEKKMGPSVVAKASGCFLSSKRGLLPAGQCYCSDHKLDKQDRAGSWSQGTEHHHLGRSYSVLVEDSLVQSY